MTTFKYFVMSCVFIVSTINGYAQKNKETMILMETTLGSMKIKLYDQTPTHRDNFVKLVKEGCYNGLLFPRVISEFMIQGGDPDSKNADSTKRLGSGGPDYTIPAEILPQFYHKKGALAAARTGDQMNPQRRSSGSQFYIVQGKVYKQSELDMLKQRAGMVFSKEQIDSYTTVGGVPHLDAQYTVFGEVIEGLDIIDKIAAVKCGSNDRPATDVKIISAKVIE